jgi:hypothetical protein
MTKMKNVIILFTITLSSLITFGQNTNNYIDYYNLTNKGDSLFYFKNVSLAYECYKKAFEMVDYIHISKLLRGAALAAKQNDFNSVYKFSKFAEIQGAETDYFIYKEFYKWRVFKQYRKTLYYKVFMDSLKRFQTMYFENLNIDYKKQIDSLYYIDQRIIRQNKSVKGNYKIDKSSLPDNLFDLDSLVFANILALIDKYGFATEENIGPVSFRNLSIIYHHNIRLPENEKYINLAQKALKEGAFLPDNYAWMYDQSREFLKEKPYFYYDCDTINLNELTKKEINKRRYEWGIKPLEAFKIKVTKKYITQEKLW